MDPKVCNMLVLAAFGLVMAQPGERTFLGIVFAVGVGGLVPEPQGGRFFPQCPYRRYSSTASHLAPGVLWHTSLVAPIFFRIQRRGELVHRKPRSVFALAVGLLALSQFVRSLSPPAAAIMLIAGDCRILGTAQQ